jgi:hypothetical protein
LRVALLDPRLSPPRLEEVAQTLLSVAQDAESIWREVSRILGPGVELPSGQPLHPKNLRGIRGKVDLHTLGDRIEGERLRALFEDLVSAYRVLNPPSSEISLGEAICIIAALCAAEQIGIRGDTKCISYPVNLGKTISNGLMEFVRERRIPILYGESEAADPLALALIAALADAYTVEPITLRVEGFSPSPEGGRQPPRLIIGRVPEEYGQDVLGVVETVVDDVTGEHASHIARLLLGAGALDINIIPSIGKEGRPQYVIRVAADPTRIQDIIETMFDAGLTLGVRVGQVRRVKLAREVVRVEVPTPRGLRSVRVKIARTPSGRVVWKKPDFEDVVQLAREAGWSLTEASAAINRVIYEKLLS